MTALRPPAADDPVLTSPPAARSRRASWRDPRLAVGVLLVAGSVLAGATVLADEDAGVPVLAAREPLAAGQRLESDDLTTVTVRFPDAEAAARYLAADGRAALTGGAQPAVMTRAVEAGELLPRTAVSTSAADVAAALVEVPLAVDGGRVPLTVRTGALIDVWVTSGDGADATTSAGATRVLEAVPVVALSRAAVPGTARQVVVGVPVTLQDRLPQVIGRLSAGSPLVVRRAAAAAP